MFYNYAGLTWIPNNRHRKMALKFFSKNLTCINLLKKKKLYNHIKVITVVLKFCYIISNTEMQETGGTENQSQGKDENDYQTSFCSFKNFFFPWLKN